jgi:hypothetical protein
MKMGSMAAHFHAFICSIYAYSYRGLTLPRPAAENSVQPDNRHQHKQQMPRGALSPPHQKAHPVNDHQYREQPPEQTLIFHNRIIAPKEKDDRQ